MQNMTKGVEMKNFRDFAAPIALALASVAAPAVAQDEVPAVEWDAKDAPDTGKGEALEAITAMFGNLFQAEALTAEQEARLPAARQVIGAMMPDGFYGKMMSGVMEKTMRPMMSMFTTPEFIISSRLDVDPKTIDDLSEDEQREIAAMLDPAWDRRVDAIVGILSGKMGGMFEALEPPMREGLTRAYAVRFDDAQLADIAAFFATPTGAAYAQESMALFADPQVMSSTMQAMPAMMAGFGDMEGAMTEAMAALPAERGYSDLAAAERARLAKLLGVAPAKLGSVVKPPKEADETGTMPES